MILQILLVWLLQVEQNFTLSRINLYQGRPCLYKQGKPLILSFCDWTVRILLRWYKNEKCQLLLARYWHAILFSRIHLKGKSITPPPLLFFWEIYELFRSSHRRCFMKKFVLKSFAILTGKLRVCNLLKRDFSTGFPTEYCKIFKSTYFEEHLLNGCYWFFKKATEQRWAAAFVFTQIIHLQVMGN